MGSEKDTGRTLQGTDWLSDAPTGPQTPLLVLVLRSVVLEMAAVVVVFLLKLAAVVLLKMEPLVLVLAAVVGMLLGVMGSPK